eukprot:s1054_g1.t1
MTKCAGGNFLGKNRLQAETTTPAPSISPSLHCARATPLPPDMRDDPLPPRRLESTNGLRQASLSPPFQFRPDPLVQMPQQRQPSQISQISQHSQPQMHSHQPPLHSQYSWCYYPVNYFASKTDSQMQFISARPNPEPPLSWQRQAPTPLSRYRVAEQPKTAPIYPMQPMHSNSRLSRPVQHVTEAPMYWQCSQAWQAPHGGVVRRTCTSRTLSQPRDGRIAMSVNGLKFVQGQYGSTPLETKSGSYIYYGDAGHFHDWEFKTRLRIVLFESASVDPVVAAPDEDEEPEDMSTFPDLAGKPTSPKSPSTPNSGKAGGARSTGAKPLDRGPLVNKIVEGLRGDAFPIASDVGLDHLTAPGRIYDYHDDVDEYEAIALNCLVDVEDVDEKQAGDAIQLQFAAHAACGKAKGKGKFGPKGKSGGKGKLVRSQLRIEQRRAKLAELKKRSKCMRCGAMGHWAGGPVCKFPGSRGPDAQKGSMAKPTAHFAADMSDSSSDEGLLLEAFLAGRPVAHMAFCQTGPSSSQPRSCIECSSCSVPLGPQCDNEAREK